MCLIRGVTHRRNTVSDNREKQKQNCTAFTCKMNAKSHGVAKELHWVKTWENKPYWADFSTTPKNNTTQREHIGTSFPSVQNGFIGCRQLSQFCAQVLQNSYPSLYEMESKFVTRTSAWADKTFSGHSRIGSF